jgi:hypothetical protein
MRDYSLIPMTPHKWENWDCCPDHLRIDLNHKTLKIQDYSGNRYASNEIGLEFGLNQMEAKVAIRMLLGKDIAHKTDATMREAMTRYRALIPANCQTVYRYAETHHHSKNHMFKLIKKYNLQPLAVLSKFMYYDVNDLNAIFEKGL